MLCRCVERPLRNRRSYGQINYQLIIMAFKKKMLKDNIPRGPITRPCTIERRDRVVDDARG